LLPLAFDNAGANLGRGLAFLMLLVGVVKLFQASGAARAVGIFITAVQAVVTHAIAIAIARLESSPPTHKHESDRYIARQLPKVHLWSGWEAAWSPAGAVLHCKLGCRLALLPGN